MKQNIKNGTKLVNLNVGQRKAFVIINKNGIEINVDVNVSS